MPMATAHLTAFIMSLFQSVLIREVPLYCNCLTLFADKGKVVVGLDGKNWFSFEVSMNLADLLQCGRLAVGATINAGLRGQLGRLTSAHREFIRALNRFLLSNTSFDI